MWFILNIHWIKYLNSHYSRDGSLGLPPPLPGEGPKPPESRARSCYLPISLSLSNESVIISCKVEQLPQQRWGEHPSLTAFPLFLERWVQRLSGRAGNPAEASWSRAVGSQQEQWHCSSGGCVRSEITWQTEPLRGPHTK